MGMWQGISQGLAAAESSKLAKEQMELRKKSEDRLDEQFNENKITTAMERIASYNTLTRPKSKSNGNSVTDAATLKTALTAITNMLPEGSSIAAKFANANIADVTAALKLATAQKISLERDGGSFSPQAAEAFFGDVYQTVVEDSQSFDPEEFAERLGIDFDGEYAPGITWSEYLTASSAVPGSSSTIVIPRVTADPIKPAERTSFIGMYTNGLKDALLNEQSKLNARVASGNSLEDDVVKGPALESAIANLGGDTPSIGAALLLVPEVGTQLAIQLVETDKRFAKFASLDLMKGNRMQFFDGQEDLFTKAIQMGMFKEGDTVIFNGQVQTITQATIDTARGN